MTIRVDPERNEIRALKEVGTWRGKKVLEIGCGNGRADPTARGPKSKIDPCH